MPKHDRPFAKQDLVHQWHECVLHVGANAKGLPLINVAGRERQIEQFATVIENQMKFEAKKPAGGHVATLSQEQHGCSCAGIKPPSGSHVSSARRAET